MQDGDEREIVRNGPLSIYARCATVAGNDTIRMYAKTDVDGAIMFTGWGDSLDGSTAGDFLDTTTPETDREWDNSANGAPGTQTNAAVVTGVTKIVDHYDDNYLIAPGGQAISGSPKPSCWRSTTSERGASSRARCTSGISARWAPAAP